MNATCQPLERLTAARDADVNHNSVERREGRTKVRVLFTYAGGSGHAEPMVPVADALRSAGHTVAFTGAARPLASLAARGFEALTLGQPATEAVAMTESATELKPLVEPDQDHEDDVIRRVYAGTATQRRVPLYAEMFKYWRPDLVVRDEVDFASAILAEAHDLPHAVVIVIGAGGFIRPDVVAEPLDAVRAQHGLPGDPELAVLGRDLVLCPFPPRFRDPDYPLPETTQYFGPATAATPGAVPSWLAALDHRPTVYVTLGTVFPLESGDLFRRLLAGIAALPVNVITTIGRELHPDALGRQPSNVRIEPWLAHDMVLPQADLVVSHGGSGTVTAALAHGLPQIVVAMGADQMLNARRVESLGVGRSLHPITSTPETVRAAVEAVLNDAEMRAAAEAMKREIDAMPSPAAAVPVLEDLAARRRRRVDRVGGSRARRG